MNVLFYISSMSDLMINTVLKHDMRNDSVLVVTMRRDVYSFMYQLGIDCIILSQTKPISTRDRDRMFREMAMPGEFGQSVFLGTDLPMWQVLGIDRFRLWYTPHNLDYVRFIDNLTWDKAYVSLDIGDALPMAISLLAYDRGISCVAVQTEPIRTLEVYDLAHSFSFTEYYVNTQSDKDFLVSAGLGALSFGYEIARSAYPNKDTVRNAMNIDKATTITGVFLDKRDERQCRVFLDMITTLGSPDIIWVFPTDSRGAELAPKLLHQYSQYLTVMEDRKMIAACDELVSFRWDDSYCLDVPIPVIIFDPHGINRSDLIAPRGIEIRRLTV